MAEAFKDADIVYPKSWAPYKVMEKRTELLRANDHDGLKALEQACLAQNANHKDWHCTEEMMAQTKNGEALYMHCLPADITGVSCDEGKSPKRSSKNTVSPPTKKPAGSHTSSPP
jgi:ornithine carbamoyltransferase